MSNDLLCYGIYLLPSAPQRFDGRIICTNQTDPTLASWLQDLFYHQEGPGWFFFLYCFSWDGFCSLTRCLPLVFCRFSCSGLGFDHDQQVQSLVLISCLGFELYQQVWFCTLQYIILVEYRHIVLQFFKSQMLSCALVSEVSFVFKHISFGYVRYLYLISR